MVSGNFVAGDGILVHNCFLMLTYRAMRDPMSPVVYDNYDEFDRQVRRWLAAADWESNQRNREGRRMRVKRTPLDTLGLGIDCSDSLLFEGVTVLLTKSANTHFLDGLPVTDRVTVTFSLNPEREADLFPLRFFAGSANNCMSRRAWPDLWEGKFTDGVRITPLIEDRLYACLHAQRLGYEVRWRIDPILTPDGWEQDYRDFFLQAARMGLAPRYITLGTYRQKNDQLDTWRRLWGLLAPEWEPEALETDGGWSSSWNVLRPKTASGSWTPNSSTPTSRPWSKAGLRPI